MAVLTIRIPDEKHERLKKLADNRHISLNKLIEELSTIALTEFDAQTRFQARAARGSAQKGVKLLNKLDKYHKGY
jgi:predicted transcriptional regulator